MKIPDLEKLNKEVNIAIDKAQKHNKTDVSVVVDKYSEGAQLNVAYAMQRQGHRVYFNKDWQKRVCLNININNGDSPRG